MSSYLGHSSSQSQQQRVKVVDGYALQQRLGSGSFAVVYKGVRLSNSQQEDAPNQQENRPATVACKAIARTSEKLTPKVLQNLEIEIRILQTYRHANIVCLHNVVKTAGHFYLLLEYCAGGDVQGLIRSRRAGRLSERLTRRLMRDLAAGLKFLWSQQLIHRDLKPQNLLLTGPLPAEDEVDDPPAAPCTPQASSGAVFALKIADFGFARHLQTASLAETLCGSPIYMAPEILQHQRYDAKADLWSVGTVLFEMICGRPPFHGENHMDLLRNIQRKAVRLPANVRVSKECVNLLRLLLHRNPLSRAGFQEFFTACDAFVALGCRGSPTQDPGSATPASEPSPSSSQQQAQQQRGDLGTIPENHNHQNSLMTVATTAPQPVPVQNRIAATAAVTTPPPAVVSTVTPPFGPAPTPPMPTTLAKLSAPAAGGRPTAQQQYTLAPLVPSPPVTGAYFVPSAGLPEPPVLSLNNPAAVTATAATQRLERHVQMVEAAPTPAAAPRLTDGSLQTSSGENSFVMVEHGSSLYQNTTPTASDNLGSMRAPPQQPQQQQPSSGGVGYFFGKSPVQRGRGDYMVVKQQQQQQQPSPTTGAMPPLQPPKQHHHGLLSTSPGTGGALMGMLMGGGGRGARCLTSGTTTTSSKKLVETTRINELSRMLAAAEDIGRRAISVAHLGDNRAYLAMKLIMMNESSSSLFSTSPMEGIEEEEGESADARRGMVDGGGGGGGAVSEDEASTEYLARRRRSSSATDKSMSDAREEDDEEDEMPFAVSSQPAVPPVTTVIPVRSSSSSGVYKGGSSMGSIGGGVTRQQHAKPTPATIRSYFSDALGCYLKALRMLKGAVSAAEKVATEMQDVEKQVLTADQRSLVHKVKLRCGVTSGWLSGQFRGVLERADAANVEIGKIQAGTEQTTATVSAEELIYNHALGQGREGAVKQLLGQFEAARSCYRSAGLLAETLLMEPRIDDEDRKTLEGYVDGFAARINELDETMLQQSRLSSAASSVATASRRSPGIVGLVGHPPLDAPQPAFVQQANGREQQYP